jgi:hypothetical protein
MTQFIFWLLNYQNHKDYGWIKAATLIKNNKDCLNAAIFVAAPPVRIHNYYYYLKDRKDISIINAYLLSLDQDLIKISHINNNCPIKIWLSHNNIDELEKVFQLIYSKELFKRNNIISLSETTHLYFVTKE